MATMKTLNGYGFNATEFNGKTASDYLQKTDTATNSAKLGGKAPEYYLQPRNLLDNSDFRNPVNQRGETSYNGSGYTIDRWHTNMGAFATVTVGNGKITLHKSSSGGDFMQTLPVNLTGKTMTYAVMTADGNIYCKSAVISDSFVFTQIAGLKAYLGVAVVDGQTVFTIYFNDSSDITLELVWVALYEGTYTADTLPPYVPKGYAAELAECDLYYRPLGDNIMSVIGMTSSDGGTALFKSIRPMREGGVPTVINNGTLYARVNGTDYTTTNVRVNKSDKSGVEIFADAGGAPSKQTAMMHGSALFALSRDL